MLKLMALAVSLTACSAAFVDDLQVYETKCLGDNMFNCQDEGCVPMNKYCNGFPDCNDGSDENFCLQSKPDPVFCNVTHQFLCKDQSRCIPVLWVCNGSPDCSDGSDEASCIPLDSYGENSTCKGFQCKSDRKCISKYWMCDGVYDCEDRSDEDIYGSCLHIIHNPERYNSDGQHCLELMHLMPKPYLCLDSSYCLSTTNMCDGLADCRDGSDEGVFCKNWNTMCTNFTCPDVDSKCRPEREGPTCGCDYGQRYNNNTRKCDHINECLEIQPECSQKCSQAGHVVCECEKGYLPDFIRYLCFAQGPEGMLFFSTSTDIRYYGLKTKTQITVSSGHIQAHGVIYDGNHVYWVETAKGHQAIYRAELENFEKTKEILVSVGLEDPGDLAIDFLGQQLYFTDVERRFIAVCYLDGTFCSTLNTNAKFPKFITLDVKKGMMYWADLHGTPVIMQARMDGSNSEVLVPNLTKFATGLAMDAPNGRLYYVEETIKAVRVDNKKYYALFNVPFYHPYSLSVFENTVYWSDWTSNSILSVNKIQTKTWMRNVVLSLKTPIYGLHVYHPVLFTAESNPCHEHVCSHFCFVTSATTHVCGCPDGMKLNNTSCTHDENFRPEYLVIGGGSVFSRLQYNSLGLPRHEVTTFNIGRVQAMAYDNSRDMLYIFDSQRHAVSKVNISEFMTGAAQVIFYTGVDNIVDMEYDYVSDLLFILDAGRRSVEVISMRTYKRTIIYRFGVEEKPLSFCLMVDYGRMLVAVAESEDSRNVHIDSINLNGQGRTHVITNNLKGEHVRLRYAAHLDVVFVSDEANGIIETFHPKGTGRENFRSLSTTISSLAVTDTLVFWTERRSKRLYWADVQETQRIRRFEMTMFPNNTVLQVLSTTPPPNPKSPLSKHPCLINNTCTEFCIPTPGPDRSTMGYTCLCSPGMMLINGICHKQVKCSHNELYCHLSNMCIGKTKKCDGNGDCPFGEDEVGCNNVKPVVQIPNTWMDGYPNAGPSKAKPLKECETDKFQCKDDKRCVERSLVCDRTKDCSDGSDEDPELCDTMSCMDTEFMCTAGNCILKSWQCDGADDCDDGSDELQCMDKTCSLGLFQCGSGECIDMRKRCDAQQDCLDFSDEDQCMDENITEMEDESTSCAAWEYRCELNTSICKPLTARCNNKVDCPGGSDEKGCGHDRCAAAGMFHCFEENRCFPMNSVCDGSINCADGSDETPQACELVKRPPKLYQNRNFVECHNGFRCRNGQCVEWYEVCNNARDCADGSDEGDLCSTACIKNNCSQICEPTSNGPRCTCSVGYQIGSDGVSCADVDECAGEPCAHTCRNAPTSYFCGCYRGYALRSDRHSCKAVKGNLVVLYVSGNSVRSTSAEGYGAVAFNDPTVASINDIGVDVRKNHLYVTSADAGKLIEVNSTRDTVTVTNIGQPGRVAVDWVTGNVYFVDGTPKDSYIRVCNVGKKRCAKLQKLSSGTQVTALAIDPASYRMFYCVTQSHELEAVVWSASLTGRSARDVATLRNCTGLTVDSYKSRVYVAQTGPAVIWQMDLDGQNMKKTYKDDQHLQAPHDLAIFEDHVYFLVTNAFKLSRCLLYGRKQCEPYMYRVFDANTFVIQHESVQRDDIINKCEGFTCSNVCVIEASGPVCVCGDGSWASSGECPLDVYQLPLFNGWSQKDLDHASTVTTTLVVCIVILVLLSICGLIYYHYVYRTRNSHSYMQVLFRNARDNEVLTTNEVSAQDDSIHEFSNPIQLLRSYWQQSFRVRPGKNPLLSNVLQSTSNTESNVKDEEIMQNLLNEKLFC